MNVLKKKKMKSFFKKDFKECDHVLHGGSVCIFPDCD